MSIGIKRAFAKYAPDWRYDAMVASINYINYPVDVPWSQKRLEELYDAADVVHLHNTLHAHRWYDNGQGKPTVLMHHGLHNGSDRSYPMVVREAEDMGAISVCSTLDLAIHDWRVLWLPPPVDIKRMRNIRRQHYRTRRRLRVGHAPTNREIKGTAAFEAAMKQLEERLPVEMVLIEHQPWVNCLNVKATVDVFFDQPILGYGVNAIEAWAMGIPVIAGVENPIVREGMLDKWDVLPFYETTEETLYDALSAMVQDADLRAEYSKLGTQHVERWHSEAVTVKALKDIYHSAPKTTPGGHEKRWRKPREIPPKTYLRTTGRVLAK